MSSIHLSYLGVHQIFQLALAAQEMGELERLYCSFLDAPGKWGHLLARTVQAASLRPLGAGQLKPGKVTEIPWPVLARQLRSRLGGGATDYYWSNTWFDRTVAARLKSSSGRIFVGGETCARDSFRAAGARGMKRVLDCHGIPAEFLLAQINRAAEDLGIECPTMTSSARMNERKAEEMAQADVLLIYSELQRSYYLGKGFPDSKLRINPLWVDPLFARGGPRRLPSSGPLKALIVGLATVAKGVPYALQAVEQLGDRVRLTLCGGVDETVRRWAGNRLATHRLLDWIPRSELAALYADHDVLLFPTLGDSFGFVALEAMACGLPVIATRNAGAPLPDESWRVPSHDAAALAARLEHYATDRAALAADGERAVEFARQFTPEHFRNRAAAIFRECL